MILNSEKKAKVLVVEDNQESVDLLVYFLKPAGYEVAVAKDGVEAIEMVEKDSPDIVLLDVMLPKIDGYQICERLKKDQRTFHIPIIMITALKELKDKIRALEAGADDFVSKPFDNVELLARVKSLLRLKAYHNELIQKNQELQAQKDALLRDDLLKKELTNLIVHDMKNPLFVIQGNLQMMAMNQEEGLNFNKDIYTQRIARSTRSLLRMILNLLDISRLEQNTMEIELVPVDLNTLITDVVSSFKDIPEHQTKSVHLKLQDELSNIYVDKDVFERVLDNLFNYVFQNTPEYMSVLIEEEELKDGRIRFSVTHDGRPVPEKFRKKIFLKNAQIELKKAGFKPARGLGLIFCKLAIDAQDGTLCLSSEFEDRNSFIMEIPTLKYAKSRKNAGNKSQKTVESE